MASVESGFCYSPSPSPNPSPIASLKRKRTPTASAQGNRSRQVTEFRDNFGTFIFYSRNLEDDPDFALSPFRDPFADDDEEEVEEEDTNHVDDPRKAIITHFRQVRESFGFDVDVVVPSWAALKFIPIDMSDRVSCGFLIEPTKVAIDGINEDLGSKSYELVELVKAVLCGIFSQHLTISAKKLDVDDGGEAQLVTIQAIVVSSPGQKPQLDQWRFKP